MRTWQTQLATAMVALGVLPGVFCFYLAYKAFSASNDMLLIVMPIVGAAALVGGFVLTVGAGTAAVGLIAGKPGARVQVLLGGVVLAGCGVIVVVPEPLVGLLLILYGGSLAWLMLSSGAARDLGSFREALPKQPAPWGSRPGTGLWSAEPPQQGPWSVPPTTLPWGSFTGRSGPTTPWWQTWQAGLAQGIPLWELVVLVVALVGVLTGNALVLLGLRGTAFFGTLRVHGSGALLGLLLIGGGIGVIAALEKRMRKRLEGRRARH